MPNGAGITGEIKNRLSIVDVVSSYITLEQSGVNYKAKCPFHNEKTPSFFVSTERDSYYCFGCSAKGDIFSFVENFEGVDFRGALKTLAERAGVPLVWEKGEVKDDKDKLYEILEKATVFFEEQYAKNSSAKDYLKGRGLSEDTIKNFRIGFAPNLWRSVSDELLKQGFSEALIEKAGLIKRSSKTIEAGKDGFYDRFRGRIMFPINDTSGRVIAFSGRIFGRDDAEEAKYLNSPDTILFNKSNVLFGIDKAKLSIRTKGYAVVVEGQLDLLLSHQIGITNTVAVSGTALSSSVVDSESNAVNNLGLIRRLTPNVIFAFDGDSAGVRAAGRSALIALSLDMQVKIAVLPEGKDPADIIKDSPNEWKNILKNSTHIISFYIDRICKGTEDKRLIGRQIREIVFPYINVIKSAIDQSSYINEIYKKTGIPESAIERDFAVYKNSQDKQILNKIEDNQNSPNKQPGSRRASIEKQLFGIIASQEEKNWENEDIKKRIDKFKELIGSNTYEELKNNYENEKSALALETEMWYGGNTERIRKDVDELSLNLEEELLQEKITDISEKIYDNEKNGDNQKAQLLLKDYQDLITRIQNIKSRRSQ